MAFHVIVAMSSLELPATLVLVWWMAPAGSLSGVLSTSWLAGVATAPTPLPDLDQHVSGHQPHAFVRRRGVGPHPLEGPEQSRNHVEWFHGGFTASECVGIRANRIRILLVPTTYCHAPANAASRPFYHAKQSDGRLVPCLNSMRECVPSRPPCSSAVRLCIDLVAERT